MNDPILGTASKLYDFCLWPYEPLTHAAGKRPYSDLLRESFELAPRPDRLQGLLKRVQDALGPQATVWGIKWDGQALSWELYFYDYARLERSVSIERLRAVLPAQRANRVYVRSRRAGGDVWQRHPCGQSVHDERRWLRSSATGLQRLQ